MSESEELKRRTKKPFTLMKVKEESEKKKTGLKLNIQKTKIMACDSIISWQIDGGTMETVTDFIFWTPISLQMVTAAMKLKDAFLKSRQHTKKQRHYFADKGPYSESYGFSSSHVWM